jgi:hypothetical protein
MKRSPDIDSNLLAEIRAGLAKVDNSETDKGFWQRIFAVRESARKGIELSLSAEYLWRLFAPNELKNIRNLSPESILNYLEFKNTMAVDLEEAYKSQFACKEILFPEREFVLPEFTQILTALGQISVEQLKKIKLFQSPILLLMPPIKCQDLISVFNKLEGDDDYYFSPLQAGENCRNFHIEHSLDSNYWHLQILDGGLGAAGIGAAGLEEDFPQRDNLRQRMDNFDANYRRVGFSGMDLKTYLIWQTWKIANKKTDVFVAASDSSQSTDTSVPYTILNYQHKIDGVVLNLGTCSFGRGANARITISPQLFQLNLEHQCDRAEIRACLNLRL